MHHFDVPPELVEPGASLDKSWNKLKQKLFSRGLKSKLKNQLKKL